MTTPSVAEDLHRLEEEAAMYRRPEFDARLTGAQRGALADIERRIAELRRSIGLANTVTLP